MDGTTNYWQSGGNTGNHTFILYNPDPIKISGMSITNRNGVNYSIIKYSIYASNDNETYVPLLENGTNNVTAVGSSWSFTIPSSKRDFYKYYKMVCSSTANTYVIIDVLTITATYMYTPSDNSIPVKGNGLTLGITEGDHECAINSAYASNQRFTNIVAGSIYGTAYGTSTTGLGNSTVGKTVGVTTSAQYSGLVVDTTYLGSFSPTFAIKY